MIHWLKFHGVLGNDSPNVKDLERNKYEIEKKKKTSFGPGCHRFIIFLRGACERHGKTSKLPRLGGRNRKYKVSPRIF